MPSGPELLRPASALAVKTAALEIMSQHALGPLLLRRRDLERGLAAPRTDGWVVPAPPPSYRGRVSSEELEDVRRACLERTQLVAAAHPPFGLALWISTMIQRFLREPIGIGGRVPKDFRDLAAAAHERILATWAPDFDEAGFAVDLSDPARLRAMAEAGPPELGSHPSLGYAPITQAALLQLGSSALASRIDSLLVAADRESQEWRAAAAELKEARKAHRIWDGSELSVPRIAQGTVRVERERFEAMIAVETLYEAMTTAANGFGPFRLRAALRPFLSEFKLQETTRYMSFSPSSGVAQRGQCLFTRAVMGHALATLTRTMEGVFPGLLALARADSDEDIAQIARGPARVSPFRETSPHEGEDGVLEPHTTEDQLFDGFDRAGLFRILDQALAHAAALGGLREASKRAKQRVGLLDKVQPFSKSAHEDARDGVEARRAWHAEVLRACATQAGEIAFLNVRGFFQVDAYRALDRLHRITESLRAALAQSTPFNLGGEPPTHVLGIGDLRNTFLELVEIIGRATHLRGTKLELADQVAALLIAPPTANPFRGERRLLSQSLVIRGVTETIRERAGTSFVDLLREYAATMASHQSHKSQADRARSAMTVWDHLRWESPVKLELHEAASKSLQFLERGQRCFYDIHAILARALEEYPPGAVFFGLSNLKNVAEQIHSRARATMSKQEPWKPYLVGREQFVGALQTWTVGLMQVFGVLWSPSEILERYATRNLS